MAAKLRKIVEMRRTALDYPNGIAAAIFGTWSFPLTEEPTGIGLLHFTDAGRAIQFVFDPQRPEKRIPMRLWYYVESPTHLR